MSFLTGPAALAPPGSTGNNTHSGVRPHPAAARKAGVLVIEAIGATPTITAKLQGTLDPPEIGDGSANWFDLAVIEPGSDSVVASITKTATGAFPMYLAQAHTRFVRRIRLVTSANTNVTYRGELYEKSDI